MDEAREKLKTILAATLEQDIDELRDEMSASDFPDWDSLAHLNIVIAIEKEFGIRFAIAEISRLKQPDQTIGSLLQLISQKKASA